MPRKKGGLPYEVHPTPAKGKDGKNIMYVKPARGQLYEILGFDSPNNECRQRGICPACRTHIPFPKLKINAHLFGSLLTYSYLCKREVFTVVNI